MRRTATAIMGTCAALVLGATVAAAQAPDTNNATTVTFSAPVSLPGVTLPAGSYLFKLGDSQVNRNIVQVFDKDRSKILATILAMPAERDQPADETVITFGESPANSAPAIRYWYYPGEKRGQEFVYPKKQAIAIANAAHTPVLSVDTDDTSAEAMTKGQVSRVEPAAEAAATPSPSAEPQSAPAAAQPTQPAATQPEAPQPRTTEPPAAAPSAQTTPAPAPTASTASATQGAVGTSGSKPAKSSLPKTASTLPLVGLAGLLALVSAFGVRAVRRAQV